MKLIKPLFSILALVALSAQAGLLNISTNNLQSRSLSASGCAIVDSTGPTYQGYKVLIVFAESREGNSDPVLMVQDLRGTNVWANDDWTDSQYLNGARLNVSASDLAATFRNSVGRTPGLATDAGLLALFRPGEAICAFSREYVSESLRSVTIAITDITALSTRSEVLKSLDTTKLVPIPRE